MVLMLRQHSRIELSLLLAACSISLHLKRSMEAAEEWQWRLQDLSLQCQAPSMTSGWILQDLSLQCHSSN